MNDFENLRIRPIVFAIAVVRTANLSNDHTVRKLKRASNGSRCLTAAPKKFSYLVLFPMNSRTKTGQIVQTDYRSVRYLIDFIVSPGRITRRSAPRPFGVALRAIAAAARRRRTGLVLCRRFELTPTSDPYAATLFKFLKIGSPGRNRN
jgi:hypothetical protein